MAINLSAWSLTALQRPLWAFYRATDQEGSRIAWLWDQGKIAEEDGVVGFQDDEFDISDAGMFISAEL